MDTAFDPGRSEKRARAESLVIACLLVALALFTITDIVSDIGEGASYLHLSGEFMIAITAFVSAILLFRRTRFLGGQVEEQRRVAARAEAARQQALLEAKRWRDEAKTLLKGLSEAIDAQMVRWGLSNAEKEVAFLLLKGLSLKEIAEVRGVTEKTARAQSFAVYAKSGLSGRNELSAFFLEDLMVTPVEEAMISFDA